MPSRPSSATFWRAYLNYDAFNPQQAWDTIGGSIGETYGPPNANTCAARVSYGMNYGGAPVEQYVAASVNLSDHSYHGKSGDGKRYVVSAMQMAAYLKSKWGNPDHQITTVTQLNKVMSGLGAKCAIFATPHPPGGHGHSGVLKAGYSDPYVSGQLPVDVWMLP
jgi:hypothetical protein